MSKPAIAPEVIFSIKLEKISSSARFLPLRIVDDIKFHAIDTTLTEFRSKAFRPIGRTREKMSHSQTEGFRLKSRAVSTWQCHHSPCSLKGISKMISSLGPALPPPFAPLCRGPAGNPPVRLWSNSSQCGW